MLRKGSSPQKPGEGVVNLPSSSQHLAYSKTPLAM